MDHTDDEQVFNCEGDMQPQLEKLDPENKRVTEECKELRLQKDDLQLQVQKLEAENKRLTDEFNGQRAKLKELFLQKDTELFRKSEENFSLSEQVKQLKNELDDVKSQLVVNRITVESNFVEKRKAEEEIANWQTLVHETIEESSSTQTEYDNKLLKLESHIEDLQKEIAILQEQRQLTQNANQEHSLAPSVVLNALTKIRKLGVDTFSSQDDDSSKKAQYDTELLKSLVEPLEDQIKALKEKLRATDEQLQKCNECKHSVEPDGQKGVDRSSQHVHLQTTASTNTSFDMQKNGLCDMCSNYEAQLVKEQQKNSELTVKVQVAEKATERHREDLLKEIGFRKEMEERWNEKKEEHKHQVAELTKITECTELDLKELREYFEEARSEMRASLAKVTKDREKIYHELDKLQKENDHLVGKYAIHSQDLESEAINLPDTVEDLHELVLKNHQELIIAKIGKEVLEEKIIGLESELVLTKDQVENERREKTSLEREVISLQRQLVQHENERRHILGDQEKLKITNHKVTELEEKITELQNAIRQLEGQNGELKNRVHSLQQDLDTSETVQKDFVRLSQSLQMELEKIRELDHEVRWQHDEDVSECPACRSPFSRDRKRQHCRHCGRIFCPSCLSRTVQSGPNLRPSKVCDVCHTLLVKSSAPYFSEAPPLN
ncbi:rab GTPase-binding effector protein 1 [Cylas formicarius]|uniref:rab GTPase-binding effector protein 1 n=1 Tax=Cylas formicarius TaxID=197179 RepID=UPI002958B30A|nr:rab GTPase-binding effector protein 1 [Cylas formicarius]